jgi:hypothetical protein
MTIAIILNAVSTVLLLALMAATMRLPFHLRSGEEVQARAKRQRVRQPRPVRADHLALRAGRGQLASD